MKRYIGTCLPHAGRYMQSRTGAVTQVSIGLESATSQHSNNFKNSKIGSTWIQFLYGSKHISSRLTLSKVMLPVKLTDLATGGEVTTGGEVKVTPAYDMSGLLCTHILRQ